MSARLGGSKDLCPAKARISARVDLHGSRFNPGVDGGRVSISGRPRSKVNFFPFCQKRTLDFK